MLLILSTLPFSTFLCSSHFYVFHKDVEPTLVKRSFVSFSLLQLYSPVASERSGRLTSARYLCDGTSLLPCVLCSVHDKKGSSHVGPWEGVVSSAFTLRRCNFYISVNL